MHFGQRRHAFTGRLQACRQPKCLMSRLAKIERVSMRSNGPSAVMPAQRHPAALRAWIPVFAGIHVFLAAAAGALALCAIRPVPVIVT
jgi:hypothetical protein